MAKDVPLIDFSDPAMKKMAVAFVKNLDGMHWFDIRKCRDQRSHAQNAYYYGIVIPDVAAGLEEAWGEKLSYAQTHEFLKDKFLAEPVVNYKTGEISGKTFPSSADLDVKEFKDYLDKIILFAAEYLNTKVRWPNERAIVEVAQ